MKRQLGTDRQLYTIFLMFGVISVIGVSSMQSVFAAPDPQQSYIQTTAPLGSTVDITIGQAAGNGLTISNAIRVYDEAKNDADDLGSAALDGCPTTTNNGVDIWQLVRASDDAPIGYKFAAGGALGQLTTKYGTGVGDTSGNTVAVNVNGDTTLRYSGADGTLGVSQAAAYWKKIVGVNNINTDNLGPQSFLSCGTEGGAGYLGGGQVTIVKPVAGEIIPVSTTALLLAGISTSAIWLVPLAAVAAGAFAVIRFQINRN